MSQKPNIYGQETINKKVAELIKTKERLMNERNELTKRIKNLDKQIIMWQKEISPNQISMGLFDL